MIGDMRIRHLPGTQPSARCSEMNSDATIISAGEAIAFGANPKIIILSKGILRVDARRNSLA